jgi:hypothetical protein
VVVLDVAFLDCKDRAVSKLIVEIHVPLSSGPAASDGHPSSWIEPVQEFIMMLDGPHGAYYYDDGEEWENDAGEPEYLFFLHNGSESELLEIARTVALQPGVPEGVYVTVNSEDGDMGEGRRVDLAL